MLSQLLIVNERRLASGAGAPRGIACSWKETDNIMQRRKLVLALLFVLSFMLIPSTNHVLAEGTDASFSINASEKITDEDLGYVEEGMLLAQRYLSENFDIEISQPTIVNVQATRAPGNPSVVAASTMNAIIIYTKSHGWYAAPPFSRISTVIHEYMHVYQYNQLEHGTTFVPAWMMEGTAEYFSTDALIGHGLVNRADADLYNFWALSQTPGLGNLDEYESIQAYQQESASLYALSYFGMQYLAREHGPQSIADFFALAGEGDAWEDAFSSAFGIDPNRFYADFAAARDEFILVTNPPRAYADLDPQEIAASTRDVHAPTSISAGTLLIITAQSEPNARCIFYFSGESIDLSEETTVDGSGNLFWITIIPEDTAPQRVEFSIDCGGGEALGALEIRQELPGFHRILR
jgi:Protein of unknown function (DUF1570)